MVSRSDRLSKARNTILSRDPGYGNLVSRREAVGQGLDTHSLSIENLTHYVLLYSLIIIVIIILTSICFLSVDLLRPLLGSFAIGFPPRLSPPSCSISSLVCLDSCIPRSRDPGDEPRSVVVFLASLVGGARMSSVIRGKGSMATPHANGTQW